MANATYLRMKSYVEDNYTPSTAVIDVDGVEVDIQFNYLLIEQWGKEGTKQYICAEALWQTGNFADAHEILKVDATGKITLDAEGKVSSDTRTWQKKWIDEHSLPVSADPLADPLAK